jgi:LmbE family N-acetylglucosaminyl deacetylase
MLIICAMLILALSLATLFVMAKAWRLRTTIYRYEVRRDQRYEFPPRTTQIAGQLLKGRLEIPQPIRSGGVVLLELRIGSTLVGHWFEPFIEIQTARGRWRQPFERGGSGRRFVEVGQIMQNGETTLLLKGRFLKIRDQPVVLHCLRHDIDLDRQRILVLGTHPDDAEIAAFGLYCDRDAYVVTLTAGEAGDLGPFERFGADAYGEKGRNRAWNSVTVPMLGGLSIERAANLGYFDGTLTAMKERPDVPMRSLQAGTAETLAAFGQSHNASLIEPRASRAATWANLVSDLEHLVKKIQPDILVTPYPRLDAHPDHKMSTVALLEALQNLNWRHGSLLLYTTHLYCSDRYPFGNAGDLVSLPPGVDDIFFDGIVSNPLDVKRQAQKHMALDAMIDLRSNIRIESPRNIAKALKQALKWAITDGQDSYFRKAVRPNELFFEVHVASLYEPGVIERIIG